MPHLVPQLDKARDKLAQLDNKLGGMADDDHLKKLLEDTKAEMRDLAVQVGSALRVQRLCQPTVVPTNGGANQRWCQLLCGLSVFSSSSSSSPLQLKEISAKRRQIHEAQRQIKQESMEAKRGMENLQVCSMPFAFCFCFVSVQLALSHLPVCGP